MLSKAEFSRFRGFDRMRVDLAPNAYIVGPNSAGKSTVIESIGLAEHCLEHARRKAPTIRVDHRGEMRKAYPLPPLADEDGGEDPVRHDFGLAEAMASIYWDNGAAVHLVWPERTDERGDGFFYLDAPGGLAPRSIASVRDLFVPAYVVPVVTPIDRVEELKNADYVRRLGGSRLASRHFRNHAFRMYQDGAWNSFREFAATWLPEIELLDVEFLPSANRLSIYYRERGSRVPKELAWAGDGIQIWVQLIWHIFRARESRTIVLDEPEVYLHPDLQRRLVRLLDGLNAQVILASHSADVIAEAPPDAVVWLDRRLNQAIRARGRRALSALSASLGTSFNLALARSARTSIVVASDVEDPRVIRHLAKHVGAMRVAEEHAVNIVQLKDVNNWAGTERMGELLREALPVSIPAVVLLAAGHRPDAVNRQLVRELSAPGNEVVFWSTVEVENHLLHPSIIARASGAAPEAIEDRLSEAFESLRATTRADIGAAAVRAAVSNASATELRAAEDRFDALWSTQRSRLVRASLVLAELNIWIEREGYRLISALTLAKAARAQELPAEVFRTLLSIDEKGG